MDALITWLVGESASVADPAFCARCFVLLLCVVLASAVAHDLLSVSR